MASYKGRYRVLNPEKYLGDPTTVIYRSLWERKFAHFFDTHPSILEWSSEEIIIRYLSPIDNRWHRYFPDFWIKVKTKDDTVVEYVVEVKPAKQTLQPKPLSESKRITPRRHAKYTKEIETWAINQAKWKFAECYCKERNQQFIILTEAHLPKSFIGPNYRASKKQQP
jgi:hypothetical protein